MTSESSDMLSNPINTEGLLINPSTFLTVLSTGAGMENTENLQPTSTTTEISSALIQEMQSSLQLDISQTSVVPAALSAVAVNLSGITTSFLYEASSLAAGTSSGTSILSLAGRFSTSFNTLSAGPSIHITPSHTLKSLHPPSSISSVVVDVSMEMPNLGRSTGSNRRQLYIAMGTVGGVLLLIILVSLIILSILFSIHSHKKMKERQKRRIMGKKMFSSRYPFVCTCI